MDSRIALALAEKLRRIYEKPDTYLTYPLGVGFPNRSLGFMKDLAQSGLGAAEQLREKVAFARNLNIVPNDSAVFPADATEPLWVRTQQVLRDAIFAKSGLTPDEEKRLADAIDFLTDVQKLTGDVEIVVNSAVLNRYYTFRMAYDSAEAMYLDEKITVETSTGPEGDALKARWNQIRERQLKDAMQFALDNWNNQGQALQVRAAIQTKNELELKKYLNLYRDAYQDEIEMAEIPDLDTKGLGVYATFFSPYDFYEQPGSWSTLTLTRTELDGLANTATPELKGLFGSDPNVTVESVSLEYANIAIVRPWFRPEFFASRTWKLPDASLVSNGAAPRSGIIPGYITSILATRNITITRAVGAPATPICIPILSKDPITHAFKGDQIKQISNNNLAIQSAYLTVNPQVRKAAPQMTVAAAPVALKANVARTAINPNLARAAVSPNVAMTTTQFSTAAKAELLGKTTFNKNTTLAMGQINNERMIEILKVKQDGTVVAAPPASKTPPAPPITPPPQQERYAFDGIIVLAYVCKRVALSPNPDPSLPW